MGEFEGKWNSYLHLSARLLCCVSQTLIEPRSLLFIGVSRIPEQTRANFEQTRGEGDFIQIPANAHPRLTITGLASNSGVDMDQL